MAAEGVADSQIPYICLCMGLTPGWIGELDPQQQKAVLHEGGPVIVLAGAGTGKTRVLTYRIAYLIEKGVPPGAIVALTFTNKAADTMRTRLQKLVGNAAHGVWMGTFHSLFARWLRLYLQGEPVSSRFVIYDADDSLALVRTILKEQGLNPKEAGTYRTIISRWKNQGLRPSHIFPTTPTETRAHSLYQTYQTRLRLADALDFDDLLLEMDSLLTREPAVLHELQNRFQHILVDEYQDTNAIQYQVIAKLAARHRQLFVVGDDAQSIYRFRGADVHNFRRLQSDFPEVQVIKLEKNYRSTPAILRLANETLRNSQMLMAKELFTNRPEGPKPLLLEDFSTPAEEAAFVARKIRELVLREHFPYGEIAVLYRTNAYSRAFEEALRREGIPYRLVGAVSFYQREEVKHFLAYLRLVHNPHDDQALLRIVNVPPRGIGEATLSKWQEGAITLGQSLWESLPKVAASLAPAARQALLRFKAFVEELRSRVAELPLPILAEEVLAASRLIEYYREDARAQERQENLESLLEAINTYYVNQGEEGDLAGFLVQSALYTPEEDTEMQGDAVWLSTIHGVKGMEFQVVFLVGLVEGLLPHIRAYEEGIEGEEEERRIFYVGLTRAAQQLYLCRPRYTGQMRIAEPSSFLEELRPLLEERRSPKTSSFMVSPPRPLISPSRSTPTPSSSSGSTLSLSQLRPGVQVHHSHFGRGTVIECTDNGAAGIVVINFDRFGKKRLDLRYAKLRLA